MTLRDDYEHWARNFARRIGEGWGDFLDRIVAEATEAAEDGVLKSDWAQNGVADASEITMGWDDSTRTLSIQPSDVEFNYFLNGSKYTEAGKLTETITDTEGLWVFYLDSEGSITSALNPTPSQVDTVIRTAAILAYVYWDATNKDGRLQYELHGADMSPTTHSYLHFINRAQYISGMALTDMSVDENGNDDEDAQFGIAAGSFADEDIFEELSAVTAGDPIEVWYRDGANGDWRWTDNTISGESFPVLSASGGSNRLAYNEWTGATWQQTEVTNSDFVLCHIFATNIVDDDGTGQKYIAIQGQEEYGSTGAARDGALVEITTLAYGTLPLEEIVPVATVIYQTRNTSSNKVKARVQSTDSGDDYVDWREDTPAGAGGNTFGDPRQKWTMVNATAAVDLESGQYCLCDATSGAFTVTLPTASGLSGHSIVVKKTDASANAVTIDGDGAETVDGAATASLASQYNALYLTCDGSNWWVS